MKLQRPGVSINPSGRPPLTLDQKTAMEMMKADSPDNAAWMRWARENPDCPWEVRKALAIHLDNRVNGQPAQSVGISHLTPQIKIIKKE